MTFLTRQLPSGKWGIYSGDSLLATVGCQSTCETILANLVSGRRDAPIDDVNELYRAPQLRRRGKTEGEISPLPPQDTPSSQKSVSAEKLKDRQLAEELKHQPVKVKQIETVLQEGKSQAARAQITQKGAGKDSAKSTKAHRLEASRKRKASSLSKAASKTASKA